MWLVDVVSWRVKFMGVVIRRWAWLECIGVVSVSGCCCKEVQWNQA